MFGKTEKKIDDDKPKDRFLKKEVQYIYGAMGVVVFVDTLTGVNYMMSIEGSEPVVMLDSDGKPLIDEEYAHHSQE